MIDQLIDRSMYRSIDRTSCNRENLKSLMLQLRFDIFISYWVTLYHLTHFYRTTSTKINYLLKYVTYSSFNKKKLDRSSEHIYLSLQFLWLSISYDHKRHSSGKFIVKSAAQCAAPLTKMLMLLQFFGLL